MNKLLKDLKQQGCITLKVKKNRHLKEDLTLRFDKKKGKLVLC